MDSFCNLVFDRLMSNHLIHSESIFLKENLQSNQQLLIIVVSFAQC